MSHTNNLNPSLELAQVCWVVPDINAAVKFLESTLGITGFHPAQHIKAQDITMSYYGKIVPGEWLTTQTYNGIYMELVQPLSGQSMFHDYLAKYPAGGIQHHAFRLPVSGFEKKTSELREQGYALMSEVDHPIARMAFFDTYQTLGVATEITGVTPEGWNVLKQMEQPR